MSNKYQDVIDFLRLNGFTYFYNNNPQTFTNNKCKITIIEETGEESHSYYQVECKDKMYYDIFTRSSNINMYWLIGFLTHNELMDKNYKKL